MAFVSIFLALLALGFLIFIHELGHYFMAKRVGMRVETFSIGMGSPIFSWMWDGTKWQIGWIFFGGYVRIAGTDSEKSQDLSQVKDGYFSKSPWDRIKVSVMGPLVNILFALLAFSLLWISGGREKSFAEYTKKIGLVDPKSELFAQGIRSGDEIWSLNGKPYNGAHDLIYLGVTETGPVEIKGAKINYATLEKTPFTVQAHPYPHPLRQDREFLTTGILAPANFLIYDKLPNGSENPIISTSPLKDSGLQYGDQIVWIDGKRVFSLPDLSATLNDERALLTIQRDGKTFIARVPRVKVHDLILTPEFQNELTDWRFAAQLNAEKFSTLYVLPYNLTNDGIVENRLTFIDDHDEQQTFPKNPETSLELPLIRGDRILAVDGLPIKHSSDILKLLQKRHVQLIISRPAAGQTKTVLSQAADGFFDRSVNTADLNALIEKIGTPVPEYKKGTLILLKPVQPKTHRELYAESPENKALLEAEKKKIAAVTDPLKKEELTLLLEKNQSKLELGVPVRDLRVEYNPVPTTQFMNVLKDITRTLQSLFTGSLNPKWMSGPVGIVSMFQEQTRSGIGDTLYWLGLISLNLGFLNLLPIPMLDGGTILINLIEWISGRKMKPETLEKIILPFAVLLILFFIFLTYHDISRLFGG